MPSPASRAVVTGASSGIGAALATELAQRGYSLILVARRKDLLQKLARALTARYSITVEIQVVDLADPPQRGLLTGELAQRDITILCNNAGIATFGPVTGLNPAAERAEVQLNAVAVHDITLAVLPQMVSRNAGGILITGSVAGNMPIPNNATYAATKAFVNSWSESLRGELKGSGVHVTLLAPGPVRAQLPDRANASIVDKMVPGALWADTTYTARTALNGLSRNKMRVVPGPIGKGMSVAAGYSPRALLGPVVGRFYRKLSD